jgi:hypothetical protein
VMHLGAPINVPPIDAHAPDCLCHPPQGLTMLICTAVCRHARVPHVGVGLPRCASSSCTHHRRHRAMRAAQQLVGCVCMHADRWFVRPCCDCRAAGPGLAPLRHVPLQGACASRGVRPTVAATLPAHAHAWPVSALPANTAHLTTAAHTTHTHTPLQQTAGQPRHVLPAVHHSAGREPVCAQ